MGSYRVGIGFKDCPKCDNNPNCIVDVWDEDYSGVTESYFCAFCNPERTNSFLREYINAKIYSKVFNLMNKAGPNKEEEIANAIIEILKYDDNDFKSNEILKKISGLREFNLKDIFDFSKVREIVRNELRK